MELLASHIINTAKGSELMVLTIKMVVVGGNGGKGQPKKTWMSGV